MSRKVLRNPPGGHDIGDPDAEESGTATEPEGRLDRAPDGVRRRSYDRAFEPAVARGLLTVQAAWSRGSREAYASGLERRYRLTHALALEVADNSLALGEALEILDAQSGGAQPQLTGTPGKSHPRWLAIAVVVAGGLLLLGRYGQAQWEDQGQFARAIERLSLAAMSKARAASVRQEQTPTPAPAPQVELDELGQVTQVSGGNPRTVLEEICRLASSPASCPWIDLRHAEPRHPGLRIGRFPAADGEVWSVLLRRDRSSGRWSVGTGLLLIQPFPDEELTTDRIDSNSWDGS